MLWHFDVIMRFFIFLVDFGQFSVLFDSCFPILRKEWGMLESVGISSEQVRWVYYLLMKHSTTSVCVCLKLNSMIAVKQKNSGWRLHKNLRTCVWHQHQRPECGDSRLLVLEATRSINCNSTWGCIFGWWLLIYIYIFYRFCSAMNATTVIHHLLQDRKGKWVCMLQDLFFFFASNSKDIFKKHLEYLVIKCKISPLQMMLKLFTEEGLVMPASLIFLVPFSYYLFL